MNSEMAAAQSGHKGGQTMRLSITAAAALLALVCGAAGCVWSIGLQKELPAVPAGQMMQPDLTAARKLAAQLQELYDANQPVFIEEKGGWPQPHQKLGTVAVADAGIECSIYYGDTPADLRKGACCYDDQPGHIPGGGKTMLIGAHNNTYFHTLGAAEIGSRVQVETYYGSYTYEVYDTAVVREDDPTVYDLNADTETLILYTCYPFDQLSRTYYRYFLYCKPVWGQPIAEVQP